MGIVRRSQWAGAEGIRFKFRHASRSPHVQELTGEAERVDDVVMTSTGKCQQLGFQVR